MSYIADSTTQHKGPAADAFAGQVDWDRRIGLCDSYARPRELALAMLHTREPRRRLEMFGFWGNLCDAPWAHRSLFAGMLRQDIARTGLIEALDPEAREWFCSLPREVEIFRGCERGRVRGLHWTTEERIARGFARGKRCRNHNPTLAHAIIPKEHVLFVFLSRQEWEVVVDPRRLRRIKIEAVS
jgi:hypothetical protein